MPEAKKNIERGQADMQLDGFEKIFDESIEVTTATATVSGDSNYNPQIERLLDRLAEIISISVDQRMENARLATQIVDNQQQLIATQQILIRLMEKSIELTRHISTIEDKLPVIFELPRIVDSLKDRVIRMEGIEID